MIKIKVKSECTGCGACRNICPKSCIAMRADEEGFLYPTVDETKCINCELCDKVCPVKNKPIQNNECIQAYACKGKDDSVRMSSSSGGIFSIIAENILKKDGFVCGAAYDEQFNVKHYIVDSVNDLYKLRGSKYVQSDTNDVYKQIKQKLINNRFVLFSGTPCQTAGLKNFLKKEYDNLLCISVACHGVPSPMVYNLYLDNISNGSRIHNVNFRSKETGWKKYSVIIETEKKNIKNYNYENPYMRGFINDLYTRPSCSECQFKGSDIPGDILLADFWGIENVLPDFEDEKGVSAILVKSQKGKNIIEEISEEILLKECNYTDIIKYNPSIIKASKAHQKRNEFFDRVNSRNFTKLIHKYLPESKIIWLKRKIKMCFSSIK